MTHVVAAAISIAINPLLLVLLVAAPFLGARKEAPWRFWLVSAVGVGLAVGAAELGKALPVWPGHPSFPSGHEAFAVAAAARVAQRSIRWLFATIPLCGLLASTLVIANFHHPVDIAGAVMVGVLAALLAERLARWIAPETRKTLGG